MTLNPYLTFNGTCEEAMNFYKACLGGEFESLNRFNDGPDEMDGRPVPEHMKNKIMHMTWRFDDNVVMASDGFEEAIGGGNVTLSINMDSAAQLDNVFGKISEGGEITMPPNDTFWGSRFGMLTDRFGIKWMLNSEMGH